SCVDAGDTCVDAEGSCVDAGGSCVDAGGTCVDAEGSCVDAEGSCVLVGASYGLAPSSRALAGSFLPAGDAAGRRDPGTGASRGRWTMSPVTGSPGCPERRHLSGLRTEVVYKGGGKDCAIA